jgi:hypothetical protein
MGKKINVDKSDAEKSADETEDIIEIASVIEASEIMETSDQPVTAGSIDVAKVIKSTGGIQAAINSAGPMIDQIGLQARLEAQRASALAMKEYRRQLQSIVGSMQGTIREEGVRLAEQICARITTQIRQAVLIETEKKALNLVDEFVLGWQIEAESMSQDLMAVSAEPGYELPELKLPSRVGSSEESREEEPAAIEKAAKPVEAVTEKEKVNIPMNPVAEKQAAPNPVSKKQPENTGMERQKTEQSENEKKVVFDFATFIAQSKSPVKS